MCICKNNWKTEVEFHLFFWEGLTFSNIKMTFRQRRMTNDTSLFTIASLRDWGESMMQFSWMHHLKECKSFSVRLCISLFSVYIFCWGAKLLIGGSAVFLRCAISKLWQELFPDLQPLLQTANGNIRTLEQYNFLAPLCIWFTVLEQRFMATYMIQLALLSLIMMMNK